MTTNRKRRNKEEKHASDKLKKNPTIQNSLSKAIDTVHGAKLQTQKLHSQWRAHLYRMSLLVGILAVHQCYQVMKQCFNDSTGNEFQMRNISELKVTLAIVLDGCLSEILNIAAIFAIFNFLTISNPQANFSSPSYIVSCFLVMSSIAGFYAYQFKDEVSRKNEKQLPISSVFHVIVTVCYWFMDVGISKCNNNIQVVEEYEKALKAKSLASHKNKTK